MKNFKNKAVIMPDNFFICDVSVVIMSIFSARQSKPIIKINIVTVLLLLSVSFTGFGQVSFNKQKISKSTIKIVGNLAKTNVVVGGDVLYSEIYIKQFDFFVELMKNASEDELRELTNHPNAVIRCYAFWALSSVSSSGLLNIVVSHINDTSYVRTLSGCSERRELVGDFYIKVVTPEHLSLGCKKIDSFQKRYLDSILIYTPNILNARVSAITNAYLTDKLYDRIRELWKQEQNQNALIKLAEYRKPQDAPAIIEALTDNRHVKDRDFAYQAVSKYPYRDFFPILKKHLHEILKEEPYYSNEWRSLYKAIASYKSEDALRLLDWSLKTAKHNELRIFHIESICAAIAEFKSPIYDDILWTIWTDENLISEDNFEYLKTKDSQKLFNLSVQTLNHFDSANNSDVEFLIPKMLDVVLAKDKKQGLEIIRKNLKEKNVYVSEFLKFAAIAEEIKDTSFVEPLLERLNTELNPHIYLTAAEILISYNSSDINRRILEAKKVNAQLNKDWGGEEFAKLLEKNNIR